MEEETKQEVPEQKPDPNPPAILAYFILGLVLVSFAAFIMAGYSCVSTWMNEPMHIPSQLFH